jgi:pimeloyl-ACP methyl ester carboxylesterase
MLPAANGVLFSLSVLTDVEFVQQPLDTTLFPGAPSSAWVHGGFANAHLDTGAAILAAVKGLLKTTGYTKVATVGHSLGGALAELDALMLRLNLPSSVAVNAVTFGTPRVGNQAYANFFDSKLLGNFVRINHEFDPIPVRTSRLYVELCTEPAQIVPGRGLGFVHPSGEIHMFGDGDAIACPGQDDATDELCTISYVPNIFEADLLDHLGPYQDIYIGTLSC